MLLCYFFRKKVTKKTKILAMSRQKFRRAVANDTPKHPRMHIYISFDHTQSPPNLCSILFFLYIVLFCILRFFHIPSMVVPSKTFSPLYFSFFLFSKTSSFSFSSGEIHQSTILLRVSHI